MYLRFNELFSDMEFTCIEGDYFARQEGKAYLIMGMDEEEKKVLNPMCTNWSPSIKEFTMENRISKAIPVEEIEYIDKGWCVTALRDFGYQVNVDRKIFYEPEGIIPTARIERIVWELKLTYRYKQVKHPIKDLKKSA